MERHVGLIGFPMDLGGSMRGVDMGPSALRLAGIEERLIQLGCTVEDLGNVLVHTRALVEVQGADAHFANEIVRACEASATMVADACARSLFPVVLGGDHSVAIGTLWGLAKHYGAPGGVVWIDAHADINTPKTTVSGNVHGMPVAVALGLCGDDPRFTRPDWATQTIDPKHTVLIATRDLDVAERDYLRSVEFPRVFTMADIDRRGIADVVDEAAEIVSGAPFMHASFDIDALDPDIAPGCGTPVPGGLSYREAHTVMERLAQMPISSFDVVEVNPVLDSHNRSAEIAVDLVASLFGKTIL